MQSRLHVVTDWEAKARAALYCVVTLARQVGVTRQQLCRFFRQRFGVTAKTWLEKLRMQDAIELLRQGRRVREIAAALGYRNGTHFSRAFKARTKNSPRAFLAIERVEISAEVPKWSEMFHNGRFLGWPLRNFRGTS